MLNSKKGFTLIEIVIVIVIIAILAAMLVPNIIKWVDKAKLATLKSEADTVRTTVMSNVAQEIKEGFVLKGKVTQDDLYDFDNKFWDVVSEDAGKKLQGLDEDKDNYVSFEYNDVTLITFTYSSGNHTATYKNGSWTYE